MDIRLKILENLLSANIMKYAQNGQSYRHIIIRQVLAIPTKIFMNFFLITFCLVKKILTFCFHDPEQKRSYFYGFLISDMDLKLYSLHYGYSPESKFPDGPKCYLTQSS